jgi:hypothetical protein
LLPALLAITGCSAADPGGGGPDAGADLARHCPPLDVDAGTPGQNGRSSFGYFFGTESLATPLAAGGARASVTGWVGPGQARIATVDSSDPSVLTSAIASQQEDPCSQLVVVDVTAGQPGAADLILHDASGGEVDRVRLTVAPTATLAIDRGWVPPAVPKVLAGSLQGVHATTLAADGTVLVGTGAVQFTLSGTLTEEGGAPLQYGDRVSFRAAAGAATVQADCVAAHAEVQLEAVDPSLVDLLTITQPGGFSLLGYPVYVDAQVAGEAVWGAECAWQVAPPGANATWDGGGLIGGAPTTIYHFKGASGHYTATCTLPGGPSQTIAFDLF